jgi:hypothetical protein
MRPGDMCVVHRERNANFAFLWGDGREDMRARGELDDGDDSPDVIASISTGSTVLVLDPTGHPPIFSVGGSIIPMVRVLAGGKVGWVREGNLKVVRT